MLSGVIAVSVKDSGVLAAWSGHCETLSRLAVFACSDSDWDSGFWIPVTCAGTMSVSVET